MGERELTMKQETFCSARVMGKSWADAFREAYAPCNPKARSVYTRASQMRNNPRIVQRIAELHGAGKPLPALDAIYHQLLVVGLRLAETGKDDKTRVGPLQWVGDIPGS